MSVPPADSGTTLEFRPSLARTVIYAATSVAMAAGFLRLGYTGQTSLLPAILGAGVLFFGAGVLLAAHLPGRSLLRLTQDGFEVREVGKSSFYRWTEVSPFGLRRKLLGRTVEFADLATPGGKPEIRTLPTSYAISAIRLLQLMNEWRDRAVTRADRG